MISSEAISISTLFQNPGLQKDLSHSVKVTIHRRSVFLANQASRLHDKTISGSVSGRLTLLGLDVEEVVVTGNLLYRLEDGDASHLVWRG